MNRLRNKHIILGVTGGIAAYKSAELLRLLIKAGAQVQVVMTAAAKQFITPLTMQALSGKPVRDNLFDEQAEAAMGHIELARWADLIIIAPATADCMAQLAHGQANNLLHTLCLASRAPRIVAPAMNQQMWHDSVTQENLQHLRTHGFNIAGPASGEQACGDVGLGRMLEAEAILTFAAEQITTKAMTGLRVLITGGPTREAIDPVRYLSNNSSGKMAYALAQAASEADASVCLISGPTALTIPDGVDRVDVLSAVEMHAAVMEHIADYDVFIACAAVADYRPIEVATQKIKKSCDHMTLTLIPNPDILADVCQLDNPPFTMGFAAETNDIVEHAQKKLNNKQCDMIVANPVGFNDRGFASDDNQAFVIDNNAVEELPLQSKAQLAKQLIELIAQRIQ